MEKALSFLKQSSWTLAITIAVVIGAGLWLQSRETCLITKYSSQGIFSLETSGNVKDADAIRAIWKTTTCKDTDNEQTNLAIDHAKYSLLIDSILFLPAYTLLLFLLLLRWETGDELKFKHTLIPFLPLAAGLSDGCENLLSVLYLSDAIDWTRWMLVFTLLKFLFIVLSIAFMKVILASLSHQVEDVIRILWKFRIIVIAMLVLYLALWQADQGQDLLINLNSTPQGVIIFYTAITIMALLNWHLPKYLSQETATQDGLERPTTLRQWIKAIFNGSIAYNPDPAQQPRQVRYVKDSDLARGFGFATFLLPAFGILNVLDKYGLYHLNPHLWLVTVLGILIIVLRFNWIDNAYINSSRWRLTLHILILLAIPALIYFFSLNDKRPKDMIWLFWGFCTLALTFLLVVSIRRNLPDRIFNLSVTTLKNTKIAGWIMWPALIIGAIFIVVNFFPLFMASSFEENARYSTLFIFVSGLVAYMLFFVTLVFWARSTQIQVLQGTRNINVAGIFLVMAFLFAKMIDNKFHDVKLIGTKTADKRPRLDKYIRDWLENRDQQMSASHDTAYLYPVFIVNAYGGGIRAAAWTSLMIANLDSLVSVSVATNKKTDFQDHVFAYSGASGGTIGASVMCALRSEGKKVSIDSLVNFYKKDFLSPVVTGLIGSDFFASTTGLNLVDRAKHQDSVWEYHMENYFEISAYSNSFASIWDSSYRTPLLFSNTTLVEKGTKGIVAPVEIDTLDFPLAEDVIKLIESGQLKLSTAAFFSARFPFISPASRVDGNHHFLDGGIYENSGAETANEIARIFQRIIDSEQKWKSKFKIVIVSLKNSPPFLPETTTKNLYELSAPLKALLANVDGNATHADSTNSILFKYAYHRFFPKRVNLRSKDDTTDIHNAILPLGWQLSDQALARVKANLITEKTTSEVITQRWEDMKRDFCIRRP